MAAPGDDSASSWPHPGYAWYVVGVLAVVNIVSLIDRQILTLLVEPIRADLGISDTGISLLHGFAFAIFYSCMALPIARLADSKNRRTIIMIGITLWSLMTAACGLAKNFWQLFMARMGVGVGEATLNPSAYSLISDYFPPHRLALPMGVFAAGIPAGVGIGLIAGGAAIDVATSIGDVVVPVIGTVRPWQMVFFFVGLIGIPVALFLKTVKEPVRQDVRFTVRAKNDLASGYPVREVLRFFRSNWRTYATIFAGYTLLVTAATGFLAWTPTLLIRSFGLSAAQAGYIMGTVNLIGGTLGAVFGGALADWLQRRGDPIAKVRVLLIGGLLLPIPHILGPLMPSVGGVMFFFFFFVFLGAMTAAPTLSAIQDMTPNQMRGQASALLYFFVNLIGVGAGPFAVALVTDYVFADDMAVGYSIVIVAAVADALAIGFILLSLRPYRKSVATLG
jgi:MFS family permease